MKTRIHIFLTKYLIIAFLYPVISYTQTSNDFWGDVQFGGSAGVGFGNNYTQIMVAPGALYRFNEHVGAGVNAQYSYVKQNDIYKASIYGGSVIGVFNPLPYIQLSAELEQLRVNLKYDENYRYPFYANIDREKDFWNTALFLGAGYQMQNVTIGFRYNVLFDDNDFVYADALLPFIRVYF